MLLPPTASNLVRLLVAACAASFSTASLADHMGPSGFGSGGGLLVLSPDTLDQGHGGLGFRLTYARPDSNGLTDADRVPDTDSCDRQYFRERFILFESAGRCSECHT